MVQLKVLTAGGVQFVVVCDPFLAAECLKSPRLDKFAVAYSYLQNVRCCTSLALS